MEYKHELFILKKSSEFRNRESESAYMEYEKKISFTTVRFMIFLMGFIFFVFAISDFLHFGAGNAFALSLVLRSAGFLITIIIFFTVGFFKRYDNTLLAVSLTELAVYILYLINQCYMHSGDNTQELMAVMLFLLAIFLIPNKWKNSLTTGCLVLASYIICSIIFPSNSETTSLIRRSIYLFVCFLTCAIFLYHLEAHKRRLYAEEKLLEFMSMTDRLTGIYNQTRFEHLLGLWVKNMRHDPFCLLFFDIDNLKEINERYGHSTGDETMMDLAGLISTNIRDNDIFARREDNVFAILLDNAPLHIASDAAERMRKAVEKSGEERKITVSIGVVQYKRPEAITDLKNRALEMLKEAKAAGGNCIVAEEIPV